jgi:hypothetical protein
MLPRRHTIAGTPLRDEEPASEGFSSWSSPFKRLGGHVRQASCQSPEQELKICRQALYKASQDAWDEHRRRQDKTSRKLGSLARRTTVHFLLPGVREKLSDQIREELCHNLTIAIKLLEGEFWKLQAVRINVDNKVLKVHWELKPRLRERYHHELEDMLNHAWAGSILRRAMQKGEMEEVGFRFSPVRGWEEDYHERK